MSASKNGKAGSNSLGRSPAQPSKTTQRKKDIAAEIANTFEWMITAFILAFVFRAFVMEAFRIPTGSMADTLKGAHFRLCCEQCGYIYDHGFSPEAYIRCPDCGYICERNLVRKAGMQCPQCRNKYRDYNDFERYKLLQDTIPLGNVELPPTHCPSCGYEQGYDRVRSITTPVVNGDRIIVLKCIHQFFEPKRWDVIVFRNPLDPSENYIKRLIGLPEEKLEIIDGDIYINDQIRRKPPKVQNELWTPIYDNDYQPVRPREGSFNGHSWQQPFVNDEGSSWMLGDKDNLTQFHLNCTADQINSIVYSTSLGNDFKAAYAYDSGSDHGNMPNCSDMMVRFYIQSAQSQGCIGIALSKYENNYKAWVDLSGEMVVVKVSKGKETILVHKSTPALVFDKKTRGRAVNRPVLVKFANVDHQLIFEYGSEKMIYDMGSSPDDAGPRKAEIPPQVKIFGSGQLTLSHIAIFRDIHYLEQGRAIEGNSFTLQKDEFFVLGDNSPNSQDSRLWDRKGIGIDGEPIYREGIVPRDYVVGRALFVYWPSGFGFPWPQSLKTFLAEHGRYNRLSAVGDWLVTLRCIPNIGQLRFIYGGSNKKTINNEVNK
jgi:signal peptidase I